MLAERIRRRSFGKFKGKRKSGQADKTKKPFDMSKVTCYKCGKSGHIASDCRSKESSQAVPTKGGKSEKNSKLKTKYKALKAQVAELSKKVEKEEKSLVAKDWAESATSSDDELYEDVKCFMAKEAVQKHTSRSRRHRNRNLRHRSS
uniref:protein AIR1-like n=1 Tax=Erigeron canadensis TaxID=72917 RepID=UPI001CB94500|nr:protein AIR1-like [Erigeron canadensis]